LSGYFKKLGNGKRVPGIAHFLFIPAPFAAHGNGGICLSALVPSLPTGAGLHPAAATISPVTAFGALSGFIAQAGRFISVKPLASQPPPSGGTFKGFCLQVSGTSS